MSHVMYADGERASEARHGAAIMRRWAHNRRTTLAGLGGLEQAEPAAHWARQMAKGRAHWHTDIRDGLRVHAGRRKTEVPQ